MSYTGSWFELQEKLKEPYLLLRIKCTNTSYLRAGGYNARPYSSILGIKEGVRPSKIKGFLRWWARVIELGRNNQLSNYKDGDKKVEKYLGSEKKEYGQSKIFINIKHEETEKSKEFRNKIKELIFRYTNSLLEFKKEFEKTDLFKKAMITIHDIDFHPANPSIRFETPNSQIFSNNVTKSSLLKFINKKLSSIIQEFKVEKERYDKRRNTYSLNVDLKLNDEFSIIRELAINPRIKLILMRRGGEGDNEYIRRLVEELSVFPPNSINITIEVFARDSPNKISEWLLVGLSIISLILQLVLNGLSAFSSRGFAGVKITDIYISDKIKDILDNINRLIEAKNSNELKTSIYNLMNKTGTKGIEGVPYVPTFNKSCFRFEVYEVLERDDIKILSAINECVLKSSWKRLDNKPLSYGGERYHTWILGLPRSQRNTGYFVVNKKGEKFPRLLRRKSAIGINIFENKHKKFIILHGFISQDWPLYLKVDGDEFWLEHLPSNEYVIDLLGKIRVEKNVFEKAFEQAWSYITKYIETNKIGKT
jgi:CRISPR type III-B/RAMP module RAMP protein Cmr1